MDGGPASSGATAHVITASLADEIHVDGADGHHLARVRRLRNGEPVTAGDGAGRWRSYLVVAVADRALDLRASTPVQTEERPHPEVAVAFALTKGSKPETVVRQLTELGVDRIVPVVSARSISRPVGARSDAFEVRMQRVAREAAMQSRRAWLPDVEAPVPLARLTGRSGLVVAELGAPSSRSLGDPGPDGWTLLVGPEGGFEPGELDPLGPMPRLGLGPHVLRAETAAVAGAAALAEIRQSIGHGAWDSRPN